MGEVAEIVDKDSLRAWLEGQDRQVAVFVASRSALRVLPIVWQEAPKSDLTALPFLRANLIATVAANVPTVAIIRAAATAATTAAAAAYAAATAARATATAATAARATADATATAARAAYAAATAATAAAATAAARHDVWSEIRHDCTLAISGDSGAQPLWQGGGDGAFADMWSAIQRRAEAAENAHWQFWIDWYARVLAGADQPWPLLQEIALQGTDPDNPDAFDDSFWQGTDAEVNARIAAIVAKFKERSNTAGANDETSQKLIQASVEENADEIRNHLAGMQQLIASVIEEVRSRNDWKNCDVDELRAALGKAEEAVAQIAVVLAGRSTVTRREATSIGSLIGKYRDAAWKMAETDVGGNVSRAGRFAIVAGAAILAVKFGLSASTGMFPAALFFARPEIKDLGESVKRVWPKS